MLEQAFDRVVGHISVGISALAARRLPTLVNDMFAEALSRWAFNNWATFDHLEANCTGQLYRWLHEARRSDARFRVLEVGIENVTLTPAMWDGTESVTTAVRPDLRIRVGDRELIIEAKRLSCSGNLAREYVYNGMSRFVSARYAAREGQGMMVGYIQERLDVSTLRDRVNGYVHSHPDMGAEHKLLDEAATPTGTWLNSSHQRAVASPIDLRHVWVNLVASTS
ncbi:hypothetical protein GCM10027058_08520 [Microbacterium neimengense]